MQDLKYSDIIAGGRPPVMRLVAPPTMHDLVPAAIKAPPAQPVFKSLEGVERPVRKSSPKSASIAPPVKLKEVPIESKRTHSVPGIALAVFALLAALAGAAVSLMTSSSLQGYMFLGGGVGVVAGIVGERLGRKSPGFVYIAAILVSVLSLVLPVLLYMIGWLSL